MITLWGRRNSMNVQKVTWALKEVGLDYKRMNVGGSFGGTDTPEYLQMNPNKVVPTLVDGDVIVWESNAVVRYLARTYGQKILLPQDPATHARADQWMDWCGSFVSPSILKIFLNKIRLPAEKADLAMCAAGVTECAMHLRRLDAHLADNAYVAGEAFSMGDIPLGTAMYRYFTMDIDRPELPNVSAWYDRLQERPAYQRAVMIPFGSNVVEWDELERQGADIPD